MKFSLCMIVKNEEAVLNRCLESMASAMDEIIIVDTGSTDATKKIAAAYTDQIYDFAWTGNFAEARNYAASKATGDYIYTADADEYLESEELQKLLQLKRYCCLRLRSCKCCIAHRRNLVPYIILQRSTALNYIRDCVRLLGSIRFMRRYVWSRLCLTVRYVFSTDHRPTRQKRPRGTGSRSGS